MSQPNPEAEHQRSDRFMPVPAHSREVAVPDTDPVRRAGDVVRRLGRLGTAAVLGTARTGRSALGLDGEPGTSADLALGAATLARETAITVGQVVGVAGGMAIRAASATGHRVVDVAGSVPVVGPISSAAGSAVTNALAALAEAGRAERRLAADEAAAAARRTTTTAADAVAVVLPEALDVVIDDILATAVARLADNPGRLEPLVRGVVADLADDPDTVGPLVNAVLERVADDPTALLALIERILGPVVEDAVPAAIDRLTLEPDDIRALIWDQSGGLADEMANSFRARLVSADDGINGVTDRLLGRRWRARRRTRLAERSAATSGGDRRPTDDEVRIP